MFHTLHWMLGCCREFSFFNEGILCLPEVQNSAELYYGSLNSDFHNYTIKAERLNLRHANIPNSALPCHCEEETDESDYGSRKAQFLSNTEPSQDFLQQTACTSPEYNFNFPFLPFILLSMGITANHFNLIYPKIVMIHLSV